jgi:hypothetical protein
VTAKCPACGHIHYRPDDCLSDAAWPYTECHCHGSVDAAALPSPGERPVFGLHRLPAGERNFTMPGEAQREKEYKRWLSGLPPEETA